jgi:hypothetical protein
VHNRVEAVVTVVDTEERIHGLAIIGEIDLGEPVSAFANRIEGMYVVSGGAETLNDDTSELSTGTCNSNSHSIS